MPSAVRVHVANLRRYTLTHPDWASQSPHLVEVARLKEQIRAAWDVILLEKDVGLAPLPSAPGQPTKVDYRRTLGARYVPPADPVYVVGVKVQLHQRAAVALDQLRQRHLAPLEALSLARVQAITGWTGAPLVPPPRATIANLRAVIHRAAATVPYHDLLQYRLFGQLEDAQFTVVVDLVNDILQGTPMPQAHTHHRHPAQAACGARRAPCRPLLPPDGGPRKPVPRRPPSAGVVSRCQLGPNA